MAGWPTASSFAARSLRLGDYIRRIRGAAFDAVGFGPRETAYTIIRARPGYRLRMYEAPASHGGAALIVPAPIKRPYIWDLYPRMSVVQQLLQAGYRVHLIEWTEDQSSRTFGLAQYADRIFRECFEAMGSAPALLAGHSLGGTLATIAASLHQQNVAALVLVESPLCFGPDAGPLARAIASLAITVESAPEEVPGLGMDIVSAQAVPTSFLWDRWIDRVNSLTDPEAMQTHLLVERWMLDEFAMPGLLFAELVEQLYRRDRFMNGDLPVGARTAAARNVSMPVLMVVNEASLVVPPTAQLPFFSLARNPLNRILAYRADVGVSLEHVGALIGRSAHEKLWPEILSWARKFQYAGDFRRGRT
jgi:polyhydroxyalkanoate synthase subunit PhaC